MSGAYHFDSRSSTHMQSPRINARQPTQSKPYNTNHLREEGELACLCLVSALVIQPVLLCSVIWRFVLCATRSGHHLLIIIIIIIVIIIIIILQKGEQRGHSIIIKTTTHTLPHMHNHTCSRPRILLRQINKQFDWHD